MIHRYKLGGMNIVLDICSGSVHLVDEVAYDMIGLFETESREAIAARLAEDDPPEFVVVTRCSGSKLSKCQATDSIIGCSRVSGSSINKSGRASRSSLTVPFACSNVENSPNKITRWLRPPGLSIILLMMSR